MYFWGENLKKKSFIKTGVEKCFINQKNFQFKTNMERTKEVSKVVLTVMNKKICSNLLFITYIHTMRLLYFFIDNKKFKSLI